MKAYLEKMLEDSKYEKIFVSKELRHIKGKKPNYRMPWKKMLSKANGTYSYIGEDFLPTFKAIYDVKNKKFLEVPRNKDHADVIPTKKYEDGNYVGILYVGGEDDLFLNFTQEVDNEIYLTIMAYLRKKIDFKKITKVNIWGKDIHKSMSLNESVEEKVKRGAIIPYAIEDNEVYVALMKPSDPKYGGSDFQIAKGIQEPGESIEKTAIREGEQELGLDLSNDIKLIWDNKKGGITYFCVKVEIVGLKPEANEQGIMETGSAKWFKIFDALTLIRTWQKPVIQMLIRRLGLK